MDRIGDHRPVDHEEPAQRVAGAVADQHPAHPRAKVAHLAARLVPVAGATAGGVAGADDQVDRRFAERLKHRPQHALVVLEIGVHHGDQVGIGRHRPLQHRRCQPAPPDPADTARARLVAGKIMNLGPGAVGAVVVDDDDFPIDSAERRSDGRDQRAYVGAFVVSRDDNRKRRRGQPRPERADGTRIRPGQWFHGHAPHVATGCDNMPLRIAVN